MIGRIHQVETFGTHDGPGIRYVLFLQGCRLGCRFCHNPGSWPGDQGGEMKSATQVLADMQPYLPVYCASGGGITVSGGEPLRQAGFVAELFRRCREAGLSTVLDTAGDASWEELQTVLKYTDLVQFSIKAFTPQRYRELAKGEPQRLLDNLYRTAAQVPVVLRFVIIPGWTDNEEEWSALAETWLTLGSRCTVELLPYHTLGRQKWQDLGGQDPLAGTAACEPALLARAKDYLIARGVAIQ